MIGRLRAAYRGISPLLRDSLLSMAVRVVGLALAFLSHLILSRTLGAREYGIYVIALSWALVLVIPARLGLDNAALRFATIYRDEERFGLLRGFMFVSVVAIVAVSVAIASAMVAARAVGVPGVAEVGWPMLAGVAALTLPLALLGWSAALMRTANRIFEAQFYEQVLRPGLLIAVIGVVAVVGVGLDAEGAMAATVASAVLALAAVGYRIGRVYAGAWKHRADYSQRRLWIGVSGIMLVQAMAQELLNQIDVLMLGALADATAAAHFSAAWRLASLVPFGLVAIVTVSGPRIASAYQRRDLAEMVRIAKVNARFSLAFAILVAAVIAVIGRVVLGAFGPGFDQAYPPLLVLLLGGLVNAFTGSVGYYLLMTGRQQAALTITCIALAVSASANLLLIPRFGVLGAAIASSLCVATWNLLMLAYVRRKLGIDASAIGLPPRNPAGS